jgi:hypothetical protein
MFIDRLLFHPPLNIIWFLYFKYSHRSILLSAFINPMTTNLVVTISLSEVIDLYFGDIDKGQRDRLVWDVIDRHRMNEKDEVNRVREMDVECPYQRDDTF